MKTERWRQVERLYHSTVERPADERPAFLAAACAGDEELRREVESLLAHEEQAADFIESPALEVAARSMAEDQGAALAAGETINQYRITSPLGAGGMGEVYLAEDTRLGRRVALKFLPAQLTRDTGQLRRFEQEARAVAALSHPNVCTIHEVIETAEGRHCIVMEYIEGVTLRARLAAGRMAVGEALDTAIQVASALAAAHAAGVVHRDVKPENIMLRRDGYVKVLDFGLAKLTERHAADADKTLIHTSVGLVMGTASYMSPEQARGLPVDARTDVWSLGVVLYEMVAGGRPFDGATLTDVIVAVVERQPAPLASHAPDAPVQLERIVHRALAKDREERHPSAEDLLFELRGVRREVASAAELPAYRQPTPGSGQAATTSGRRAAISRWLSGGPPRSRLLVLGALVGVLVAAAAVWVLLGKRAAPASPLPSVPHVNRLTELAGIEEFPAISPDGKSVAFTAYAGGKRQIFVRLIAGGPPLQLTRDPVDHQLPRWSPDSSSLVYYSPPAAGETQGTLWEVSALGGASRRVASSVGGADVSLVDGRIACFRLAGQRVELVTAPRDGSAFHVVAALAPGSYYLYPRWSPDARWIAFQRGDGVRSDVFVVPAAGGDSRPLTHDQTLISGFTWLPDSTGIVFSSSRASTLPYLPTFSLWEARLGDGRLRQLTSGESSFEHPDVHQAGALVAGRMRMQVDIWKFPVEGTPRENVEGGLRMTRQTGYVQTPTAAPGDREVAFLSDSGGRTNLWVLGAESGELRQITNERDPAVAVGVPIWSPDGRSIAFVSSRGNRGLLFGLWLVDPDGSNLRRLVERGLGAAWSPDGRWLYYVEPVDDALKKIPASGGTPITVRPERTRNVIGGHGSTLYYTVERALVDGTPEFEIRAATPESGPSRVLARIPASRVAKWQIANPALSPDGKWLAQPLTDDSTTNLWALSTSTGEWRQITDFGDRSTFIARRVSWSSDGRFIFAALGEGDADIVLLERLVNPARE